MRKFLPLSYLALALASTPSAPPLAPPSEPPSTPPPWPPGKPKLKLDQAHFRAFAGWEFRDERLMQLELIDAIESEGVDPTPPAKDDGCISCCVTQ